LLLAVAVALGTEVAVVPVVMEKVVTMRIAAMKALMVKVLE
tara:strand:- start:301 stop:423 length:123 start_codon:yes stop_codon:yes gene_type:complete